MFLGELPNGLPNRISQRELDSNLYTLVAGVGRIAFVDRRLPCASRNDQKVRGYPPFGVENASHDGCPARGELPIIVKPLHGRYGMTFDADATPLILVPVEDTRELYQSAVSLWR